MGMSDMSNGVIKSMAQVSDSCAYSYLNARIQAMRMLNSKVITRTEYSNYMLVLSGAEFSRNIPYNGDLVL